MDHVHLSWDPYQRALNIAIKINDIPRNPFVFREEDKGEIEGYDRSGHPLPLSVWRNVTSGDEYIV